MSEGEMPPHHTSPSLGQGDNHFFHENIFGFPHNPCHYPQLETLHSCNSDFRVLLDLARLSDWRCIKVFNYKIHGKFKKSIP